MGLRNLHCMKLIRVSIVEAVQGGDVGTRSSALSSPDLSETNHGG